MPVSLFPTGYGVIAQSYAKSFSSQGGEEHRADVERFLAMEDSPIHKALRDLETEVSQPFQMMNRTEDLHHPPFLSFKVNLRL